MQNEIDAGLVRRAREGDKHAFGELISHHQGMVERLARHMVHDAEIARDLSQEALLAAYLSLGQLRDDARFASWLYGITLNVCRGYWRDSKETTVSFEEIAGGVRFEAIPFTTAPDPQAIAEMHELHERVRGAVNGLSPENRAATLLFYYDGLTLDEIAGALNISVGAVKGRLFKSRERLRRALLTATIEKKERATMIPVQVVDVVRHERKDKEGNVFPFHVVVLYDAQGKRALPIWVGPFEGHAIALGVMGEQAMRPMTYEFISKLLAAAGARLESVRIDSLKEDVYFATAALALEGRTTEVDARPSDAIALALRMGAPISVAEGVLKRTGIPVPRSTEIHSPPRGIEQLMQLLAQEQAAAGAFRKRPEEESKESEGELLELVFGK